MCVCVICYVFICLYAHMCMYIHVSVTVSTYRLKGQTLPLRFGQFKYSCWTTSLSTLTLMGVAVLKDLKYTTTLSLDTTKKPKPRIPKKPNQKHQKKPKPKIPKKPKPKKPKKLKKNIISELFPNITRNMHQWKSPEIMFFLGCFGFFGFGFFGIFGFVFFCIFGLFFLVFLVLVLVVSRERGLLCSRVFLTAAPLGARVDTDVVEEAYLNCRKHNGGNYAVRQTRPMPCAF